MDDLPGGFDILPAFNRGLLPLELFVDVEKVLDLDQEMGRDIAQPVEVIPKGVAVLEFTGFIGRAALSFRF